MTIPSVDLLQRRSWIGDANHKVDIRLAVLMQGLPHNRLQIESDKYCTNKAQAAYWLTIDTGSLAFQPVGSSDHALGTAFEANYTGAFRRRYLQSKFPGLYQDILGSYQPPRLDLAM